MGSYGEIGGGGSAPGGAGGGGVDEYDGVGPGGAASDGEVILEFR